MNRAPWWPSLTPRGPALWCATNAPFPVRNKDPREVQIHCALHVMALPQWLKISSFTGPKFIRNVWCRSLLCLAKTLQLTLTSWIVVPFRTQDWYRELVRPSVNRLLCTYSTDQTVAPTALTRVRVHFPTVRSARAPRMRDGCSLEHHLSEQQVCSECCRLGTLEVGSNHNAETAAQVTWLTPSQWKVQPHLAAEPQTSKMLSRVNKASSTQHPATSAVSVCARRSRIPAGQWSRLPWSRRRLRRRLGSPAAPALFGRKVAPVAFRDACTQLLTHGPVLPHSDQSSDHTHCRQDPQPATTNQVTVNRL